MRIAKYEAIRHQVEPGDIVAFGGKGRASGAIKWFTRSPVSHVGIVLQSNLMNGDQSSRDHYNELIESTSLDGSAGVIRTRLSRRIDMYDGDIWWFPLAKEVREKLDVGLMQRWLWSQDGKPYDYFQAIMSAVDFIPDTPESYISIFCSELASGGLKAGGVLPLVLNPSEVTPHDLVCFRLYGTYCQLKGDQKTIKGAGSIDPIAWATV